MNRTLSRPAARRRRAHPKAPADPKPENHSPRSPLKDLNGEVFRTSTSSCSTSSSATSIEPPRGCLRFLISNSSSSSSSSKTPLHQPKPNSTNPKISTFNSQLKPCKPSNERRKIGDGGVTRSAAEGVQKNVTRLYRWQSGQKSSSGNAHRPYKEMLSAGGDASYRNDSRSGRLAEGQGEKRERVQVRDCEGEGGKEFQLTPVSCKIGSECDLVCGFEKALGSHCDKDGRGNTPPAEASVSPEIQCGSSVMSASTPVCFGAGHVISGVSDKRKCRPRGVLVVGENCSGIDGLPNYDNYDNLDGNGDADSGRMVVPPLPAEASMHWLLPPCDEENEQNGEGELHTSIHLSSPLSCSSGYATSSNVSKDETAEIHSGATAITKPGMRISSLVSPSGSLVFQSLLGYSLDEGFISQFDEKVSPYLTGQTSQCSMDSLDSKNQIQTPESNSSTEMHMRLTRNDGHDWKHVIDSSLVSAADGQQRTSFSSEGRILAFEQVDSSFEFDSLLKPDRSIEFSQLSHNWGNPSWISEAIVDNASQSQLRISMRDGLSSRRFEMDESDCCRCLSDEEDRTDRDASNPASPEPKLPEISKESSLMRIFDVKNVTCVSRNNNSPSHKSITCAESISMDGGSLAASGDSGWDTCYKNNLFQGER